MDSFRDTLLAEITAFMAQQGMSPSRFGRESVRDSNVVQRVRESRLTLKTAERLRIFMRERKQAGQ